MVAPVTAAGVQSVDVTFPGKEPWYDVENFHTHFAPKTANIAAPLRKIPVFQRGGTIVPTKARIRRSSELGENDPFTLTVALSNSGSAAGNLYKDDYHTFNYQNGQFIDVDFKIGKASNIYTFQAVHNRLEERVALRSIEWIERIRILGFPSFPKAVISAATERGASASPLDFVFNPDKNVLDIKV